jgi:hypothetical protein
MKTKTKTKGKRRYLARGTATCAAELSGDGNVNANDPEASAEAMKEQFANSDGNGSYGTPSGNASADDPQASTETKKQQPANGDENWTDTPSPKDIRNARIGNFVARINDALTKSVQGFIEGGCVLIEAKDALDHGDFLEMLADIPLDEAKAERLMAIAKHPILSDSAHVRNLPPSYSTLYELTKLPNEKLKAMIAAGRIDRNTERKEVEELRKKLDEEEVRFHDVPNALGLLNGFRKKWPKPAAKEELVDAMLLDPENEADSNEYDIELEDLPKLVSWITALHKACEERQAEWDAEIALRKAADEAAAGKEDQTKRNRPRFKSGFKYNYVPGSNVAEQADMADQTDDAATSKEPTDADSAQV